MTNTWEIFLEKEFSAFRLLEESIPKWMDNAKAEVPAGQEVLAWAGAAWLSKAIKTYKAIGVLCRHGFGEDALSLLRGLFELLLNLVYLDVHSDERKRRLQRLQDSIELQKEESLQLVLEGPLEDPAMKQWAEEEEAKVRVAIEEITKRRSANEVKALQRDWRDRSARKIAEDKGLLSVYSRIYRSASQSLHGADVTHWLSEGPGGGLNLETEPSDSWVGAVIQIAPRVMLDILRQANELLNMGLSFPSTEAWDQAVR